MIQFFDVATKSDWNEMFTQFPEANFLQSWQWSDANHLLGSSIIRQSIIRDGSLVGLMLGIIKNAKRGRYLEVPGGPLIDWSNADLARATTDQLMHLARKYRCAFVRIRPQQENSPDNLSQLRTLGYRVAPMHLHAEHTSIIDLTQTEEDLLKNMRQQTRYEVRRVSKRGITVTRSAHSTAFDEFYKLQQETAKRQQFVPPNKHTLNAYNKAFGDQAYVYRAEKKESLLNLGLIIIAGNEADYFEAASTPDARREPGAYGIIWQAIVDAKAEGATRFNLWGIAPDNVPNHRYKGVTTFKRGFGGNDINYLPAHDLIVSHLRYTLNYLVETARKKRRKL